jgi:hypothetical protein
LLLLKEEDIAAAATAAGEAAACVRLAGVSVAAAAAPTVVVVAAKKSRPTPVPEKMPPPRIEPMHSAGSFAVARGGTVSTLIPLGAEMVVQARLLPQISLCRAANEYTRTGHK